MPQYANSIFSYEDHAQSASFGRQVFLENWTPSLARNGKEVVRLLKFIFYNWKTGDRDIFVKSIVEWLHCYEDLKSDFFLSERIGIGKFSFELAMKMFEKIKMEKNVILDVASLYETTLADANLKLHTHVINYRTLENSAISEIYPSVLKES